MEESLTYPGGETARESDSEAFESFEELYRQTRERVRRTAFSLSGQEDLDDIVQETFIRLWKARKQFRGDSGINTWVYRVTVNAARDHWRKKGRHKVKLESYRAEPKKTAQDERDRLDAQDAVSRAMETLSVEHREAVTLVYLEELSLGEAAAALDLPQGTVKSRLFHARKAMAAFLEKAGVS